MLGFQSISEQPVGSSSSSGGGSAGRGGGGAGGGRFGGGSRGQSGQASPKGHKHRRHIDHSPMPPEYWQIREEYLLRKKKEDEENTPQK